MDNECELEKRHDDSEDKSNWSNVIDFQAKSSVNSLIFREPFNEDMELEYRLKRETLWEIVTECMMYVPELDVNGRKTGNTNIKDPQSVISAIAELNKLEIMRANIKSFQD